MKIDPIVNRLVDTLHGDAPVDHICLCPLPHLDDAGRLLHKLQQLLFPGFFGRRPPDIDRLREHIDRTVVDCSELLEVEITKCLRHDRRFDDAYDEARASKEAAGQTEALLASLPELLGLIDGDVEAAYLGDPAATGYEEIIVAYPGFRAVLIYRIAHCIYLQGVPLLPRIMTEYAHSVTGIDIHPGAKIGRNFFIDHGTGVVIGETTEIGENVKLYQGVTLGALSFPTDDEGNLRRGFKRHPTIEDDVVIYSNASILGPVRIGRGCAIGGNVFLTHDVEAGSKVTIEKPENRIRRRPTEAAGTPRSRGSGPPGRR